MSLMASTEHYLYGKKSHITHIDTSCAYNDSILLLNFNLTPLALSSSIRALTSLLYCLQFISTNYIHDYLTRNLLAAEDLCSGEGYDHFHLKQGKSSSKKAKFLPPL